MQILIKGGRVVDPGNLDGIADIFIEDGKIVRPVNEMNISGNHLEFWQQLVEMGNDPYVYSSWRRPSLSFTEVEFSGL